VRWTVVVGLQAHPWVVATALIWWLATLVVWWRLPDPSGWSLLFWCSVGLLVAVTLTPSRGASAVGTRLGTCLPQWPTTGFGLLAPNPERRWNVLLGVPLGLAALAWPVRTWEGSGPGLRRWSLVGPVVALLAPAAVEYGQYRLPALARQCAVVDVVDNLSGVLVGFILTAVGVALHELVRSSPRRA